MWGPWWKYRHWAGARRWWCWCHGALPWCYPLSPEEELRFLESLKEDLEAELDEVKKRIEELRKKPGAT